jgi:hypothetical protein
MFGEIYILYVAETCGCLSTFKYMAAFGGRIFFVVVPVTGSMPKLRMFLIVAYQICRGAILYSF